MKANLYSVAWAGRTRVPKACGRAARRVEGRVSFCGGRGRGRRKQAVSGCSGPLTPDYGHSRSKQPRWQPKVAPPESWQTEAEQQGRGAVRSPGFFPRIKTNQSGGAHLSEMRGSQTPSVASPRPVSICHRKLAGPLGHHQGFLAQAPLPLWLSPPGIKGDKPPRAPSPLPPNRGPSGPKRLPLPHPAWVPLSPQGPFSALA